MFSPNISVTKNAAMNFLLHFFFQMLPSSFSYELFGPQGQHRPLSASIHHAREEHL